MRELHRLRDFNILYLDLLGSLTETNKANAVCIILLEILEVNFNFCPIARLKYSDKYTMWNNSDTLRLRMFTSKPVRTRFILFKIYYGFKIHSPTPERVKKFERYEWKLSKFKCLSIKCNWGMPYFLFKTAIKMTFFSFPDHRSVSLARCFVQCF